MKNIKIRKCRGCNADKNREEMIKITLKEGEIFVNPNSKTVGRSVYVCKNVDCIKKFIKTKGIKKGLKFNNDKEIQKAELILLNLKECLEDKLR